MLAEDLSLGLFSDSSTELTPAPLHVKAFTQLLKTEEEQGVLTVTDSPLQSPDLSPIQHLWEHLKTQKAKHSVKSQEASFRVYSVIKARGGQTKY